MFKVIWTHYGKYHKEKTFDSHSAAKGFFYGYCLKTRNIISAELKAV